MTDEMLGKVYLVGAGPGDPGLLTIKGRECLENAEVVLFDRLLHPDLLQYCPQAEKIDVGKAPGHTRISQDEINQLLVQKSEQGYTVVRLKGGDPFVFGRGGEEALALAKAGVPFEIVPGVTAGIAAPAYAGIPVTHREVSSSVTFIAGHGEEALPRLEDLPRKGTLVFYMGVNNLSRLTTGLIDHGYDCATPVCVIEWGTWPRQRVVSGNLEDIARKCEESKIEPPSIIVVGPVVHLLEHLEWFDSSLENGSSSKLENKSDEIIKN